MSVFINSADSAQRIPCEEKARIRYMLQPHLGLRKNSENLVSVKGSVDEELEVQLVQSACKRQVPTWMLEYDIGFPCKMLI